MPFTKHTAKIAGAKGKRKKTVETIAKESVSPEKIQKAIESLSGFEYLIFVAELADKIK